MIRVVIDNREVEAADGSTVLEAARTAGIEIPHLCYREGIEPQTSCLVCVVRINGGRRLMPACATRIAPGMVIESSSAEVKQARKTALELLLSEHAGECFAPCSQVCPAHLDIPEMVRLVREEQWSVAAHVVRDMLVLPATLGYVCPGLCEKGCRRGSADAAVSICQLHRSVAEREISTGKPSLPERAAQTGKRVAVIGTGSAGLAAAWELLKSGHACVLFDAKPQAGGTLRYGLEEGKLPAAILDAEIAIIRELGAEFRLGVEVGKDVSWEETCAQFDAVAVTQGKMTPGEKVFASASAVTARPHAVQAVADGKELAAEICGYLKAESRKQKAEGKTGRFAVRLGALSEQEMARWVEGADPRPRTLSSQTLTAEQATDEADRCMLCGCSSIDHCKLRKYAQEYGAEVTKYRGQRRQVRKIATHPHLVFEEGKCISCGLCIAIARKAGEPMGLSFVGRGFDVTVAAPLHKQWQDALTRAADEAAEACPTGAIHRT